VRVGSKVLLLGMSNKKKRKKNKKKNDNIAQLDPFSPQREAIAQAKKELEEAQAMMRDALKAKAKIAKQVQTLKEQTERAEAQKTEASKNLEGINNDLTSTFVSGTNDGTSESSMSATSTKTTSSVSLPSYGDKQYWNDRYSKEGINSKNAELHVDEWYIDKLDQLSPFLSTIIYDKTEQRLLDIGCGTSTIGDQLTSAGFQHVYCIDYSDAVIKTCRERQKDIILQGGASPVYTTMDARSLQYDNNYFRCVVDKGTMDAILSGGASGGEEAANEAIQSASTMVSEVYRVLEEGGTYVLISSMPPNVYLPNIKNMTKEGQFDVQHSELTASWDIKLSLQVYFLKKLKPSTLPVTGLPFSEEQVRLMMDCARAAQYEKQQNKNVRPNDGNDSNGTKTNVSTRPIKSKPISMNIIKRDQQHLWLKWRIDMTRDSITTPLKAVKIDTKGENKQERGVEEEEEDEDDGGEWGFTPVKRNDIDTSVTSATSAKVSADANGRETETINLIGGSERDYIILCREDIPHNIAHQYVSMEWLDLSGKDSGEEVREEEEEDVSGNSEFGLTPAKSGFANISASPTSNVTNVTPPRSFLEGVLKFPVPKKDGKYNFRFIAESVAWGLSEDTMIHVTNTFDVDNNNNVGNNVDGSQKKKYIEIVAPAPVSPVGGFAASASQPESMSKLLGPPLPPSMQATTDSANQKIKRLSYLLEKRTQISCYQLFVHRPTSVVGEVPLNTPAPPVPSPAHVRLRLDLKFKPILTCTRSEITLSFLNEAGDIKYLVEIPFSDCNIDPKKSTFTALNNHWSFRLPFYFGGSEMDVDREHPTYRLPRRGEVSKKAISSVRCKFCENNLFTNMEGVKRVTCAPSQYWSELSDYWFCLKEQATQRLEALSAHGGKYPIAMNDVVIDQCSLLCIFESSSLDLKDKINILPLKSSSSTGSTSPALPAPGCNGTTYEIIYRSRNISSNTCVKQGSVVKVHARGVIQSTNETFWDTKKGKDSEPFQYTAGVGSVIKGWDQGSLGMKVGEQRKLVIPSHEGYGNAGFPQWNIPPNATLIFYLECLSIHIDCSSTKSVLHNELTKALSKTRLTDENGGEGGGEREGREREREEKEHVQGHCQSRHGHNHGHEHDEIGEKKENQQENDNPAILLCQRCFSIIGTSQVRNNGTHLLRMWKCHLTMFVDDIVDANKNNAGVKSKKNKGKLNKIANVNTTFDQYLVDSIVGHAILDGMEQRGATRFTIQSFAIDDGGEVLVTNDDHIEMKISVLNAKEFVRCHESSMQPVIRILYETGDAKMQHGMSKELWQKEAIAWRRKYEPETILLSEEDVSDIIDNLQRTTQLLPKNSQSLNNMTVGFLRW
jgi:peptidylprolyl isomerase